MTTMSPPVDLAHAAPHPADPATRGVLAAQLLTPAVLMVLADGPAPVSELCAAMSELCCEGLDEGALGVLLAAAEECDLATSSILAGPAPEARTYRLTPEGREMLAGAVDAVQRNHALMTTMAVRYEQARLRLWSSKASASNS